MIEYNFKSDSFKNFLKNKESEIYKRTEDGIQETDNFKKIHRCLVTFQKKKPINDYTALLIHEEEVNNITVDYNDKLFSCLDSQEFIINNHLLLDRNFTVENCERKEIKDNNDARKYYLELSKDYCVFLINPIGVHYFVNGKDIGEAIFFSSDALNTYNELKDITKICDIFNEYRQHLKNRNNYSKFFVSKSSKSSLCKHLIGHPSDKDYEEFLKKHKQLLENKPEDGFREDLRMFLRNKLKATVLSKEYILDNFNRIDIFIQDDFGELYLIEVKWVGVSIHQRGQKIGTSYDTKDINPAAVIQTIEYIKQLYEEGKNIKIGYLVVFDARYEESTDTLNDFNESVLEEGLKEFYNRFSKIKDLRVLNIHPN